VCHRDTQDGEVKLCPRLASTEGQSSSCSPGRRAKSCLKPGCSLWRGRHSSEVPRARVPVMVQLLFDVHHVPSRLLVLPVVTFSELLKVTKLWNPRPGIVWKAERRRKVRYYRNGETHVLQISGTSYGLEKATLGASLQTTLAPQPGFSLGCSHSTACPLPDLSRSSCTGPSRQPSWEVEEANSSFLLLVGALQPSSRSKCRANSAGTAQRRPHQAELCWSL